jgi:Fur family peroxide stress response transcriptional regulator
MGNKRVPSASRAASEPLRRNGDRSREAESLKERGAVAVSVDEVTRRVERLSQGLRDAGLRLTHQRLEIVRVVAADETHPDVETVYRAVRERVPTISLDTVYRTLATLTDRGLITRVQFTAGPARYDANVARHHHFVCTRCGLVRDVEDRDLDAIRATAGVKRIGRSETVTVQFRGVCSECLRKESTTT